MENKEEFRFTYSAAQQQEIERIRQKYLPAQEDKMEQLRKLHNSATHKAQSWGITFGAVGALIMGGGMSLVMTPLGQLVGGETVAMLVGIAVGLVGMVLVALAYPLYNRILKAQRRRIAPQILQLTEELIK